LRRNSSALLNAESSAEERTTPSPVANDHAATPPAANPVSAEQAWRHEVVSRVQQHRARRRKYSDPNALELDFPADGPHSFGPDPSSPQPPPQRFAQIVVKPEPRIIRFPRPEPAYVPAVQEVTLEEMERAHPILETPRILDAPEFAHQEFEPQDGDLLDGDIPGGDIGEYASGEYLVRRPLVQESVSRPVEQQPMEQMELLPSFDDILLEAESARIHDELNAIPRPAPLTQRAASGLIDAGIVLIATGIFALTFLQMAGEVPPSRLTFVSAVAAAGIFWLLLQYIFLTYKRATPGMRMAELELCTLENAPAPMPSRQTRALSSAVSCFSLGLGYAWALVDEDRLSWHDRISQTHLKSLTAMPVARDEDIR
jgi:uncharacterized RDD family membrane protein YckC